MPGLTVTGTIRNTGFNNEYEILDLIIRNDTEQSVEAVEVAAPPQHSAPTSTATLLTTSMDTRRPQFPGDRYKPKPDAFLMGPRGQMQLSVMLGVIPDDAEIVLSAAGFSDGRGLGSRARELAEQRDREAHGNAPQENSIDVKGYARLAN